MGACCCCCASESVELYYPPPVPHVSLDGDQRAALVRELHEKARKNVEAATARYAKQANKGRKEVIFEPGDYVWLHLRKDRFPKLRKTKLHMKGEGPFQVLERINNNVYKIDLPPDWNISSSVNVADLTLFDNPFDLRTDPSQPGGNDVIYDEFYDGDPDPLATVKKIDPLIIRDGPLTRLQRKNMREALNTLLQEIHEEFGLPKKSNEAPILFMHYTFGLREDDS